MLLRSKELLGLPVISLTEGQQLGVIKGLVVDREEVCLAALIVSIKVLFKENKLLPFSKVHSVGEHAITITNATDIDKNLSHHLARLNSRSLEGTRVISDKGNAIGVVDDFIINTETGKIAFLEISGNLIEGILKKQASLPAEFIKTMGKDVIVTAKEAEENLIHSENSLQYRLKNIGDNTAKAIETTWLKTKELSRSIPLFKISKPEKSQEQANNRNEPKDYPPVEVNHPEVKDIEEKIND